MPALLLSYVEIDFVSHGVLSGMSPLWPICAFGVDVALGKHEVMLGSVWGIIKQCQFCPTDSLQGWFPCMDCKPGLPAISLDGFQKVL